MSRWSDVNGLRARSRVCFGQQYRLELMVEIAQDDEGVVNLKDLAERLAVAPGTIQRALKDLEGSGMLITLPRGDSRKLHYRRIDSAGWQFALELSDSYRNNPESPNTPLHQTDPTMAE